MRIRASMLFAAVLAFTMVGKSSFAQYVPPNLNPGDTYHLAFVTDGKTDAISASIGFYNTFVNTQAAMNAPFTGTSNGVQYRAIASTASVNANVNAPISAPVYNFNGDKIADSFADMWDGSLDNAIMYDQFGVGGFPDVWTGTDVGGAGFTNSQMGTTTSSANSVRTGLAFSAGTNWISDAFSPHSSTDGTFSPPQFSMYGLSQQLTVIPEPTSFIMFGIAMVGMARRRRLK